MRDESLATINIAGAFLLACALVILAVIALGCELTMNKSQPPAQIVTFAQTPEAIPTPRLLYRVKDGEQVFTVTSEVESNNGKHLLGSREGFVDLWYTSTPEPPVESPTAVPASPGSGAPRIVYEEGKGFRSE